MNFALYVYRYLRPLDDLRAYDLHMATRIAICACLRMRLP